MRVNVAKGLPIVAGSVLLLVSTCRIASYAAEPAAGGGERACSEIIAEYEERDRALHARYRNSRRAAGCGDVGDWGYCSSQAIDPKLKALKCAHLEEGPAIGRDEFKKIYEQCQSLIKQRRVMFDTVKKAWREKQNGYERLNNDLPEYWECRRKVEAQKTQADVDRDRADAEAAQARAEAERAREEAQPTAATPEQQAESARVAAERARAEAEGDECALEYGVEWKTRTGTDGNRHCIPANRRAADAHCRKNKGDGYRAGPILADGSVVCVPDQATADAWCAGKNGPGYRAVKINTDDGSFVCKPSRDVANAWCQEHNASGWHATNANSAGGFDCYPGKSIRNAQCRDKNGRGAWAGKPVRRGEQWVWDCHVRRTPTRGRRRGGVNRATGIVIKGVIDSIIRSQAGGGRTQPRHCHRRPGGGWHCSNS